MRATARTRLRPLRPRLQLERAERDRARRRPAVDLGVVPGVLQQRLLDAQRLVPDLAVLAEDGDRAAVAAAGDARAEHPRAAVAAPAHFVDQEVGGRMAEAARR